MSGGDFSHDFALRASELRRPWSTRPDSRSRPRRPATTSTASTCTSTDADSGPMLRAVATDGHRLARIDAEQPDGAAGMPGMIVPRKAVAELRKLVDETDGAVSIQLTDTKLRFAFDTVVLTSKLIDGTFPDYERVIPASNDKTLEADAASFEQAVDRMAAISTEKSRSVKLAIDKNRWRFRPTAPTAHRASEELPADYDGPSLEIGFNSRYVLDMAQNFDRRAHAFPDGGRGVADHRQRFEATNGPSTS